MTEKSKQKPLVLGYRVIAVIDDKTCDVCKNLHDAVIIDEDVCSENFPPYHDDSKGIACRCTVEKVWRCDWCTMYGKHPTSKAWRPMTEQPVVTGEGDNICPTCTESYYKARKEAK